MNGWEWHRHDGPDGASEWQGIGDDAVALVRRVGDAFVATVTDELCDGVYEVSHRNPEVLIGSIEGAEHPSMWFRASNRPVLCAVRVIAPGI